MWLYFDIDAQVLRPVLRQPLGHQESLCRVLHDGLKFHLSRGAALQIVPPVHQPHQWPVPLGKIHKHMRTERKITWKWKKGGVDFVKITITIKCNVLSGVMKLGQLLLGAILHPSSLFSMRYACNLSDFQTGTWNQSVVLLMCLKLRAEYTFSSV